MDHPDNLHSEFTDYFVSNIDYYNCPGLKNKLSQGLKFIHSSAAVNKINILIEKTKPDIAHLHNIYHQLSPSIIPALKKHSIKVVVTLHDGKLICPAYLMLKKGFPCIDCANGSFWRPFMTNCQENVGRGLLFTMEAYWHKWRHSYDAVDLFMTPSIFLKKLISKRIPGEKIRVVRNGIELESYLKSDADDGYGLYLGRLSREKGLVTLLEAHEKCEKTVSLKIVGTGPLEDELRGQYSRAEFLGYKRGQELKDILARCAFVVIPSEWYENCPMVVLEAMAMGKPVIGSRIGGIPEQIEDGKTGLLFEMGNVDELAEKMKTLAMDQDRRLELGIAARVKVEREYSFKDHGEQLMNLYSSMLY